MCSVRLRLTRHLGLLIASVVRYKSPIQMKRCSRRHSSPTRWWMRMGYCGCWTVYSSGFGAFAVGSCSQNEAVAAGYIAVVVGFSVAVLQPSLCLANLPLVLLRHGLVCWIGGFCSARLLLSGAAVKVLHDPAVFEGPDAGDVGPSHVNKLTATLQRCRGIAVEGTTIPTGKLCGSCPTGVRRFSD